MQVTKARLDENGRYKNEVKMIYQDLFCLGVSANKGFEVIKNVIEKMTDFDCDRLPKSKFSKYMLLEARGMAQLQVAHELLDSREEENRSMQTDGTSKKGYGYVTCDVVKDDGKVLCCGVREILSGDVKIQMGVVKKIFKDCVEVMEEGKGKEGSSKILKSIKNLMSDRCVVQKNS